MSLPWLGPYSVSDSVTGNTKHLATLTQLNRLKLHCALNPPTVVPPSNLKNAFQLILTISDTLALKLWIKLPPSPHKGSNANYHVFVAPSYFSIFFVYVLKLFFLRKNSYTD